MALQVGGDPVPTKSGGETIGTGSMVKLELLGGPAMQPAESSFITCQRRIIIRQQKKDAEDLVASHVHF